MNLAGTRQLFHASAITLVLCLCLFLVPDGKEILAGDDAPLRLGMAEVDITPVVGKQPVFLAGFGKNRLATGVHDPLFARAAVLEHRDKKIALVSVDLIGLFRETVEHVRDKLPGFAFVLVSSTHNHEGPDTLGLWGPNFFQSGIERDYLKRVEAGIIEAVLKADEGKVAVAARIGTAHLPDLLHDSRRPIVKHDELTALQFQKDGKTAGVIVAWNCHPETLESKNTLITADFVAGTVKHLKKLYNCPVLYLTGTVGGLMTSLRVEVKDEQGRPLDDGSFAKAERYGEILGERAKAALDGGHAIRLAPFEVHSRLVYLPLDNPLYLLGWQLGVLEREAFLWTGSSDKAEPLPKGALGGKRLCVRTEISWLRFGDLDVAAIPGEIYPELVLGMVGAAEPEADFPNADAEPGIYSQLKGPHRLLIGLANDELGYIIPKRQWDEKPPFAYGQKSAPYGEVNSLGPETAPLLSQTFRELVK